MPHKSRSISSTGIHKPRRRRRTGGLGHAKRGRSPVSAEWADVLRFHASAASDTDRAVAVRELRRASRARELSDRIAGVRCALGAVDVSHTQFAGLLLRATLHRGQATTLELMASLIRESLSIIQANPSNH